MPPPSYPMWLLLVFVVVCGMTILHYGKVLFAVAWLTASPFYVCAKCLESMLKVLQDRVEKEFGTMNFSWRSVVHSKLRIVYFRMFDVFVETFLSHYPEYIQGNTMIELQEVGEKVEYVPESERGKTNPATFVFEKKSRKEIAKLRDEVFGVKGGEVDKIRGATMRLKITKKQLVDWRNLSNARGEPVPFDEENKDELYDKLPGEIHEELEEKFGDGVRNYEQDEQ